MVPFFPHLFPLPLTGTACNIHAGTTPLESGPINGLADNLWPIFVFDFHLFFLARCSRLENFADGGGRIEGSI